MSCVLCSLSLDLAEFATSTVRRKGIQTIIQCSIDRKDNVADSLRNVDSVAVHDVCRRSYTYRKYNGKLITFHPPISSVSSSTTDVKFEYIPIYVKNPEATNSECTENLVAKNTTEHGTEIKYFPDGEGIALDQISDKASLSKSYPETKTDGEQTSPDDIEEEEECDDDVDPTKPFPFQHNCLFCAEEINDKAELKKKYKKRNLSHKVSKDQSKETIIRHLEKNPTPSNMQIIKRIQDVDLVQENARYHIKCYNTLLLSRKLPTDGGKSKKGRRECPFILAAVDKVYRYIDESDRTEFTSTELKNAATTSDYQPDWRTIARKLVKKYEGKIYFVGSGRSTIVTVVKKSGLVRCAVMPWNLNGTELGGPTQDIEVLKNKRKYYMSNKDLPKKEKCEQMKKKNNISIKEVICDEVSKRETSSERITTAYNDDNNDFLDDTFHSEEYAEEDEENILCCQICFSLDRKLEDLGNYSDILRQIGSGIFIHHFEPKIFLICWECIAVLRNVKRFQKKIMIAQQLWNTEVQEPPKSLSTLSTTTLSAASISNTDEKRKGNIKPEIVTVEIFPQEEKLIQDEKPVLDEIKMHYDTFEDDDTKNIGTDAMNIDDDTFNYDTNVMDDDDSNDSEYEERIRPKLKRRKAQANRKKLVDSDHDSDVPSKSTYQPKIRKPSSEDPDWGATAKDKDTPKRDKKNKVKLKIPYTMIVQAYITETKMNRESLEPHELQYWLDNELNSDYFKNLEQKCVKCISEVAENHYELWHSSENPYVCDICESTFARNDEKESHVASHYYVFSCEFCGYKCYNETHMRGHVETHRRLVQCLECFAAFETFDTLKEHFNSLHRYAECDHCGKQFPHKRAVSTHIERCHTPQICTICNTSYSSYSHKKHHMNLKHRIERTEAAYCVQCDIQFDNVALLKRHVYRSYKHKHEWKRTPPPKKVEQHKCPECPNVYALKCSMKNHYDLVHAKKITSYCNKCDKEFLSKKGYMSHMKIKHEGFKHPKNKFCHICGRGFATNKILENHIRTHTGERPFACPHCAASFAQKTALRSHIAHVHEKRQRTAGEACTKRRQSNAPPTFIDSTVGFT